MLARTITDGIIRCLDASNPKVVLVFGPRRVGKTTLLNEIARRMGGRQLLLNADFIDDARLLTPERAALERIAAGVELLIVDEAQQVPGIGRVLKLLHDTYPALRVIASGSASFDLRVQTGEPLTGRQEVFDLFPLSLTEIDPSIATSRSSMEHGMIYGSYPEVYLASGRDEKEHLLRNLTADYLLKDVLATTGVERMRVLDLLRLLAYQIGSEVSYGELAQSAHLDIKTVIRYVDLLEYAFVVRRLGAFSRNLRKEISKSRKIYFLDLGIRNALIGRFHAPADRDDTGGLWENYLVVERLKRNRYLRLPVESWFWRTYDRQEIDYVEESSGALSAFEFKWNPRRAASAPTAWARAYPDASFHRVGPDDAAAFLRY